MVAVGPLPLCNKDELQEEIDAITRRIERLQDCPPISDANMEIRRDRVRALADFRAKLERQREAMA